MNLSRKQLELLHNYERLNRSFGIFAILRLYWFSWLALIAPAVLGYWFITSGQPLGWMLVGVCLGALSRDIARIQMFFRTWPALREIIDWERVGALIKSKDRKV